MTTPRYVDCRCGHPKASHQDEHAGMCVVGGCYCVDYRAHTLGGTRRPQAPSLRELIAAGKRSKRRSTVAMAERAEAAIAGLAAALREEQDRAAREPAASVRRPPVRTAVRRTAVHPCGRDNCTREFDTAQGVSMHRRRVHEGFDPRNPTRRTA